MRRIAAIGLVMMLAGCTEGTKTEPLRREGTAPPPAKIDEKPVAPPPGSPTLYERLGREEGLQKAAGMTLADPAAKDLKGKVTPQQLATLLVESSSGERASNVPLLSAAEWETLKQSLRAVLLDLGIPGADRDEIIERVTKNKR